MPLESSATTLLTCLVQEDTYNFGKAKMLLRCSALASETSCNVKGRVSLTESMSFYLFHGR